MTLSSLGSSVPPFTPHAISVSLPTWKDNVEYEQGSKRVVDAMVNGYPRFFIHLSIRKVRLLILFLPLALSDSYLSFLPYVNKNLASKTNAVSSSPQRGSQSSVDLSCKTTHPNRSSHG